MDQDIRRFLPCGRGRADASIRAVGDGRREGNEQVRFLLSFCGIRSFGSKSHLLRKFVGTDDFVCEPQPFSSHLDVGMIWEEVSVVCTG